MMTLMWSRCICYVPWNKERTRRETMSDWKETNVIEWKGERKNDKIPKKSKGRKERAERSVILFINAHHSPGLDPFSFTQNSLSIEIRCQHDCSHIKMASTKRNCILSLFLLYIIWILTMTIVDTFSFSTIHVQQKKRIPEYARTALLFLIEFNVWT